MTQLIDIVRAFLDVVVAAGVVVIHALTYWAHVPQEP